MKLYELSEEEKRRFDRQNKFNQNTVSEIAKAWNNPETHPGTLPKVSYGNMNVDNTRPKTLATLQDPPMRQTPMSSRRVLRDSGNVQAAEPVTSPQDVVQPQPLTNYQDPKRSTTGLRNMTEPQTEPQNRPFVQELMNGNNITRISSDGKVTQSGGMRFPTAPTGRSGYGFMLSPEDQKAELERYKANVDAYRTQHGLVPLSQAQAGYYDKQAEGDKVTPKDQDKVAADFIDAYVKAKKESLDPDFPEYTDWIYRMAPGFAQGYYGNKASTTPPPVDQRVNGMEIIAPNGSLVKWNAKTQKWDLVK